MAKPSPRPTEKTPRRARVGAASSAPLLVIVALGGLVVLAATAWFVLKNAPASEQREPTTNEVAAPTTMVTHVRDDAPTNAELEARIRAEVQRVNGVAKVTFHLLHDGEPVKVAAIATRSNDADLEHSAMPSLGRGHGSAPGDLDLLVPASWPLAEAVQIMADPDAAESMSLSILRRDVVLPGCNVDFGDVPLPSTRVVTGRVLSSSGRPAANVHVAAYELGGLQIGTLLRPLLGSTCSRKDGSFELPLSARRYFMLEVDVGDAADDQANRLDDEVELGDRPLMIELAPAHSIRGVVVDPRDKPVARAGIIARMAGPTCTSSENARVDDAGAFELNHLEAGYYILDVDAPDHASRSIAAAHTDVEELRVTLTPLASAKLEIHGAPASLDVPVVWQTLALVGATLRPTSAPLLTSMRDGQLTIHGIEAGSRALQLRVPGAAPIVTPIVEFALDATTELGSFTLVAGATLAGSITDEQGRPLSARLALCAPHQVAVALESDLFALPDHVEWVTHADGRFEWIALPAGERVLALRAPGCADGNLKIVLPASGTLTLDAVTLAAAGGVAGEVRGLSGQPEAELTVQATRSGGGVVTTTTDFEGRYSFERLHPGRYEIVVLRSDEAPPAALIASNDGGEANPTALVDVKAGSTTRRDFTITFH